MVSVGALIGAFTNYIAIKMLFRPYRPLYIGKWRIPFTPGVIPSRRDEMAEQMGKMVVDHLLTPESIKKKFINKKFQMDMVQGVVKKLHQWENSDLTIAILLKKIGIEDATIQIEEKIDNVIETGYLKFTEKYQDKTIETIIPSEFTEKIKGKLPTISRYILGKGIDYFQSMEGKQRISRMLEDFMKDRGMFGNMVQMVLGNVNLADKIQPEIIKFLKNDGTVDMLTSVLNKELNKILQWDINEIEIQIEKANLLKVIKESARNIMQIESLLNKPFSEFHFSVDDPAIEDFTERVFNLAGEWLGNKIDDIMEKMHLKEIVQEQVESFSVERLELMVLSIINSELKMITYLGGLLGGMIGLVQGSIMIMLQ